MKQAIRRRFLSMVGFTAALLTGILLNGCGGGGASSNGSSAIGNTGATGTTGTSGTSQQSSTVAPRGGTYNISVGPNNLPGTFTVHIPGYVADHPLDIALSTNSTPGGGTPTTLTLESSHLFSGGYQAVAAYASGDQQGKPNLRGFQYNGVAGGENFFVPPASATTGTILTANLYAISSGAVAFQFNSDGTITGSFSLGGAALLSGFPGTASYTGTFSGRWQ